MTMTDEMTIEEARRIVAERGELEAELRPYDMPAVEVDRYRASLWHSNPEASAAQVSEALIAERRRFALERKAQKDAETRASERRAHQTRCRNCGKPSQRAVFIGTSESERSQGYRVGFRDYFCSDCRGPVAEEYTRRQAAELVDDKTRAQLAVEYFDALEAMS